MTLKQEVKRTGYAAAGSAAVVAGAGVLGNAATPLLMSQLGVVVPGVGTIFQAGGIVATVQAVSVGAVSLSVLGPTAAVGAGSYVTYLGARRLYRWRKAHDAPAAARVGEGRRGKDDELRALYRSILRKQ